MVNFMTLHTKERNFWGDKCKIDVYFSKSFSVFVGIDQTNWEWSNDNQGRDYKIDQGVNILDV